MILPSSCAERKGHVGRSCRGCSVGASRHAEKGKLGLVRMNPHESPTYRSHLLTSLREGKTLDARARRSLAIVDCNSHFLSESNLSWYNASQFRQHIRRCFGMKSETYLLLVIDKKLVG